MQKDNLYHLSYVKETRFDPHPEIPPSKNVAKEATTSYVFDENFIFPSIKSSFCYVHSMPLGGKAPSQSDAKERGGK